MGFTADQLILEIGHSKDCDETLRQEIIGITSNQFLSGEVHEVVDAVLVLTPKAGRPNHVEPSDIQDAAPIAGLSQTSTLAVASDWSATRLVARKSAKR